MTGATGRAHWFGDNVTTDDVIAGKYKHTTIDPDELAEHIMENIRPGFRAEVEPGDFIVAGTNFGCGSSREQAPQIIKHVGVQAVVAKSFARIFFRNAINIGLPLLVCDTDRLRGARTLAYDRDRDALVSDRRDIEVSAQALPPEVEEIVAAGGLLAHVRAKGTL